MVAVPAGVVIDKTTASVTDGADVRASTKEFALTCGWTTKETPEHAPLLQAAVAPSRLLPVIETVAVVPAFT